MEKIALYFLKNFNYKGISGPGDWLPAETKKEKMMTRKVTDQERGFKDRLAGFYDKWYRYNREDDGAKYDQGVVRAVNTGKCPDRFTLIEANQATRS